MRRTASTAGFTTPPIRARRPSAGEIPPDPFETPEKARDSLALGDREVAAPA
jgi:hypothetical protein